jgi:hypothetical protein
VRARVLRRDGFLCQLKIKGVCTIDAPMRGGHAHHLHGKESGCHGCAADVASHIVAACAACNLKIGDPSRAADRPNRGVTKWT